LVIGKAGATATPGGYRRGLSRELVALYDLIGRRTSLGTGENPMITNLTGLTCGLGFGLSQPPQPGFARSGSGFAHSGSGFAECLGPSVADSLLKNLGGGQPRWQALLKPDGCWRNSVGGLGGLDPWYSR
jgi:hypothetical protein